jgi:cytochrome d ubiquinol oxidase subunit II
VIVAIWYAIIAFTISMYVVLDGRNFGVGILIWIVAREPLQRRQVVEAIGPLWLWHEVWLIAFGGTLFVAFPHLLASAFPGYYLALFLILWCTILRGISLEVGGHLDDHLWQSFWDAVLFVSSALLAILFGAALGNVMRGVPLGVDGTFHMPFFTDFRPRGHVGLLDGYTLSVALFASLVLTAHGATYLMHRTEGPVCDRSARLARGLWLGSVPGFAAISGLTWRLRPELFTGLSSRPLAWIGASFSFGGAVALGRALYRKAEHRNEKLALLGSSILISGILGTGAAALYPVVLFSTLDPAVAVTAQSVAAPHDGLVAAACWWPVAAVLAFVYFFFVLRFYKGKVHRTQDDHA